MSGGNYVTLGVVPDAQNDGISATQLNIPALVSNVAQTLVAPVSGKRIFVHALMFSFGTNNATGQFLDMSSAGATVSSLTGAMPINSSVFEVLPFSQYPWFTCAPGDAFAILHSGSGTVSFGGRVLYVQG